MNTKEPSSRYKWIVLAITTSGVLMVAIDTTVVILALPDIMTELHTNLISVIWVLMGYIFANTVLLLSLGRVADIFGRVRLYNIGFAAFTFGSLLCGISQNAWELIGSRLVQGVGGALMFVNSLALVTEAFPPDQRGMAMGINSMTFGIGGIVGPVLGGIILTITSWRWIFFINVPIGILGTYLGYRLMHEMGHHQRNEKVDYVGAAIFSVSLLVLLAALTQSITLGWKSWIIYALLVVSGIGILIFIWWERRTEHPALDLRLFSNRLFDFAVLAATFQSLAIFAVQFLIVFYLQAARGDTPLRAAILLLPMPIALGLVGPLGGRISDRIGSRIPATTGLLIQAFGVYWLSTITRDSTYLHIAIGLALVGLGGGLFFSPNTSAVMSTAEKTRLGVAAAMLATLRNTGMVTGFAFSLAIAAGSIPKNLMLELFVGTAIQLSPAVKQAYVDGMRAALHVSIGISLVAVLLSLVRGIEQRRAQKP